MDNYGNRKPRLAAPPSHMYPFKATKQKCIIGPTDFTGIQCLQVTNDDSHVS